MMHILSPQSTCLAGGSQPNGATQSFFAIEGNVFSVKDCGYFVIEQSYMYSRTLVKMFVGCLANVIDYPVSAATQINPSPSYDQNIIAMNCGNNKTVSKAAAAERDLTNTFKYDYRKILSFSQDEIAKCQALMVNTESEYFYSWA